MIRSFILPVLSTKQMLTMEPKALRLAVNYKTCQLNYGWAVIHDFIYAHKLLEHLKANTSHWSSSHRFRFQKFNNDNYLRRPYLMNLDQFYWFL